MGYGLFIFGGCGWGVFGRIVQSVDGAMIVGRNQVAVDVHGDLNRAMAQGLFYVGEGVAVSDQQRGERVTDAVQLATSRARTFPVNASRRS